jgi:hypothetical protein
MREIRTYGSEGGEAVHPAFPTPIGKSMEQSRVGAFRWNALYRVPWEFPDDIG